MRNRPNVAPSPRLAGIPPRLRVKKAGTIPKRGPPNVAPAEARRTPSKPFPNSRCHIFYKVDYMTPQEPMEKNLGELEQLVLLALIRLGEDAYGVTVHQEIQQRTGRDMSFATIYTTLGRLETKGLADSFVGDPTPERGGRAKKHFTVTPAGKQALQQSLRALRTMARGLDAKWGTP